MWEHTSDSLGFCLKRLVHEYRDRTALIHYEGFSRHSYSYLDLFDLTHNLSQHLYHMGLRKGDRVLIWAPNSAQWLISFLTAAYSGLTLVPVDLLASSTFAQKILDKTDPKLVICAPDLLEKLSIGDKKHLSLQALKELARKAPATKEDKESVAITGNDLLEIVFTSGTTSEPKGILIRQHQILANTHAVRLRIIYHDRWKFLSLLPMSHLFEQVIGMVGPLYFGASIVCVSGRSIPELFAIGRKEQVTHIASVPAIIEHLKEKVLSALPSSLKSLLDPSGKNSKLESLYKVPFFLRRLLFWPIRRKLGKWQALISGGALLDKQTQLFWEVLGIRVVVGYGMSEACPIITCNSMDVRPIGSAGYGLSGQLIRIASDGEILVAGENISTGYFEKDNDEHFDSQGWFHTGDIGYMDKKGRLFVTGRKKEMIASASGLNVFPSDIETILNQYPLISESFVLEDPLSKSELIALVIVEQEKQAELSLSQLCSETNASLETHQRLSRIEFWPFEQFKKTHTLKLQRSKNLDLYKEYREKKEQKETKGTKGTEQSLEISPESDPLQQALFEILAQITQKKASELQPSQTLSHDLSMDSVDLVTLWMQLEAQVKISLPPEKIETIKTIDDLLQLMREQKKKPHAPKSRRFFFQKLPVQILREPFFWIAKALTHLFFTIKVTGKPVSPQKHKPLIFIANHASHLDSAIISASMRASLRRSSRIAAAHDHFFEGYARIKGLFLQLFLPVFGFHRSRDIFENMRILQELFSCDHPLLLFPEGTRSRDGALSDFKAGIGLIVSHFGAQVQPIFLEGTHALWPPHALFPRPGKVKVHFHKPIDFPPDTPASVITSTIEEHYKKWAKQYGENSN